LIRGIVVSNVQGSLQLTFYIKSFAGSRGGFSKEPLAVGDKKKVLLEF
jgi:hypothetical protein